MSESLEEFYTNLLEITEPWEVSAIKRDSKTKEVTAIVSLRSGTELSYPVCGIASKLHYHRSRKWRHLDSCNHKTLIEADIPRVSYPEQGLKQILVTWVV